MKSIYIMSVSALAVTMTTALPAFAQAADEATKAPQVDSKDPAFGDIIDTANRREDACSPSAPMAQI